MRASSVLFAAVLLAAASAAPAATVTTNLFEESFSTATGQWSGSSTFRYDRTWTKTGSVFGALGGAKLGSGNATGSIVSGLVPLRVADTETALSIYVQAAGYPNQSGSLLLTVLDETDGVLATWTTNLVAANVSTATDLSNMASADQFDFTFDFTTSVPFKLSLTTGGGDKRVLVGEVRVTETYETHEDAWAPVWTVGEPSPSPRVGAAFSFGVSAALADGTPQSVSFGGLSPAAAGAQPSFSGGVFSWTPGADAAGDYAAAFSVQNAGGTYTTNVAFSVRGATEETTLFWEDFPNYNNAWSSSVVVDLPTTDTRVSGWTGSKLYKARSATKLGKASDYGFATTPAIETANGAAATVKLTLDAAAYYNKSGTLGITAVDAATSAVLFSSNVVLSAMSSETLASLSGYPIGPFSFPADGTFTVTFRPISGDGRMGIDSVKVVQSVSTSLVALDPPAGLAVVGGTLSTNSFSVAWDAVEHATNYAAEAYAPGGTAPVASMRLAAPPAAFAGLADDTDYRVRVRAEGDTSLYTFSAWTGIVVRTARSALHPTLSFDGWTNAVGDGRPYAGIANTAAVSAVHDDGTDAAVAFTGISPAPLAAPSFEDGVLSWLPADEDTNTTFTVSFLMDGAYATNIPFKLLSVPFLQAPAVEASPVAWNAFGLSWDVQYRASGYGVRAWTDCPSPTATPTSMEEYFPSYYRKGGGGNRPAGWIFKVTGVGYDNGTAPVQFSADGNWMATYDLGGPIETVSFKVKGNSMANGSTLRAYWAGALTDAEMADKDNWTNNLVAAVSDLGGHDQTVTVQIPASSNARRIVWQYERHDGNVGVGSVVIGGSGFSTARWLPGWGPAAKDVGLVQSCTVAHPRPGRFLGVDPADPKEDRTVPRPNYAEVTVRDAAGTTLATVVAVPVPAPPRSVRASMLILR